MRIVIGPILAALGVAFSTFGVMVNGTPFGYAALAICACFFVITIVIAAKTPWC